MWQWKTADHFGIYTQNKSEKVPLIRKNTWKYLLGEYNVHYSSHLDEPDEYRRLILDFSEHSPKMNKSSKGIIGVVWQAANKGNIVLPCIKTAAPKK